LPELRREIEGLMTTIEIRTHRREEMIEIGSRLEKLLHDSGVRDGVMHLWSMHTTCALTVNENADPDVVRDMVGKFGRMIPKEEDFYRHAEGNSDSHLKTSLFGPGLTLLIAEGELVLGTWQGVYLAEWDGPRTRTVAVKIVADR
jgi:secondary thiamine-phosphate synthase enzyme